MKLIIITPDFKKAIFNGVVGISGQDTCTIVKCDDGETLHYVVLSPGMALIDSQSKQKLMQMKVLNWTIEV